MSQNAYSDGQVANKAALVAVGLVCVGSILNAIDVIIVRNLSPDIHPFEIVFFRALFGLIFVTPWIIKNREMLKSDHSWMHLIRATLKFLALVAFVAAIARAPIADVTAISFAAPIFLTVGGWLVLGEKPVATRVIAIAVGFIGVLVVLRPGAGAISSAIMFAVIGAILTAVFQLLSKMMLKHDLTQTLVAWNLILTVFIAAFPAWIYWTTPSLHQTGLMVLQGAMGAVNMGIMIKAMSLAEVSFIAPVDFIRLPVAAGMAYLLFGEIPGTQTWIGAAIIFSSTLLLAGSVKYWKR